MTTPPTVEERIANLEGSFEQIDRRLGTLEQDVRTLSSDMHNRMDRLEDRMDARMDRLENQMHRLMYWQLGLLAAIIVTILTIVLTRVL